MGVAVSTEKSRLDRQLRNSLDSACAEAARTIVASDVLLVCSGAGFSADSGLAVYSDVAKVPAYEHRGLGYKDLCSPYCLDDEPELFWGFWGQCYNDYRNTPPHEGYCIIDKWASLWFRHSDVSNQLRSALAQSNVIPPAENKNDPYVVSEHAGAFFTFTSNVDAHHYDWFPACEIRECHGNIELYQCAAGRRACRFASSTPLQKGHDSLGMCEQAVWRAPIDYHFHVDRQTMLAPHVNTTSENSSNGENGGRHGYSQNLGAAAPNKKSSCLSACFSTGEEKMNIEPASAGRVRGGGRALALRYMPASPTWKVNACRAGFVRNHPACPSCGGPARPAIQMFGDYGWNDVSSQRRRWHAWIEGVGHLAKDMASGASSLRVAILEIGCGSIVPTVRKNSEQQYRMLDERGANVRLIRVNPDTYMALADIPEYQPMIPVLSIRAGGLEGLRRIDAAMLSGDVGTMASKTRSMRMQ